MDPNTLNLVPDPHFWPNLDPDAGLLCNIRENEIKNNFLKKKTLF